MDNEHNVDLRGMPYRVWRKRGAAAGPWSDVASQSSGGGNKPRGRSWVGVSDGRWQSVGTRRRKQWSGTERSHEEKKEEGCHNECIPWSTLGAPASFHLLQSDRNWNKFTTLILYIQSSYSATTCGITILQLFPNCPKQKRLTGRSILANCPRTFSDTVFSHFFS